MGYRGPSVEIMSSLNKHNQILTVNRMTYTRDKLLCLMITVISLEVHDWQLNCRGIGGLYVSMILQAMPIGTFVFLVGPLKSDRHRSK